MGGFALAAAQIGQFMKLDEMSETSISHGSLSSAGSAPRPGAVVRVVADHDGIVPKCPGEGTTVINVVLDVADDGAVPRCPNGGAVVRVVADNDGAVPGRPGGGATVTDVVLDVVDDGTFEDLVEW